MFFFYGWAHNLYKYKGFHTQFIFKWKPSFIFFGPLIKKEIKKRNDQKILIGPSVFTISVCLRVFVSVSALQVTVFGVRSRFLVWMILAVIPKNDFFCFLKFWFLTYLWLFLDNFGVFSYIFSINFKRVCRSNRMT